jgi:hypothetical protein
LGGDASFEYITDEKNYVKYFSGSAMGGWRTYGRAYTVFRKNQIGVKGPFPAGLDYCGMLETELHGGTDTSYIEHTFTNLQIGSNYSLSFSHTLLKSLANLTDLTYSVGPEKLRITLNKRVVYSTVPTGTHWEQVTLSSDMDIHDIPESFISF